MVYVINKDGRPLMPTCRYGKVRHLLKDAKAKVIKRCPFTIQLLYNSTNYTQAITLGVDAGSKRIGISSTTKQRELYAAVVELRTDIVELLSTRRTCRRARRNRKTRYRKARFLNRVSTKKEGWLAPSIKHKVDTHMAVVEKIHKILPVTKIIVETASFDIQKIKNPTIAGKEYQEGDMLNFWNVREFVLFRDGYTCQCCKGKSKDKVLNVHHIESRKTGGNAPNNLITLCETCHTGYHKGTVKLPAKIKRGMSFKDASFMGILRWAFYNKLKSIYTDVKMTYGYITKNTRILNKLPKEHYIDALCITGNPQVKRIDSYYYQRKVRCHNRQIHKFNIAKGGKRKLNQAAYLVKDYRLWDKVLYENQECFISGRRTTGYFKLVKLDGTIIHNSANVKKITLLESKKQYLTERRLAVS